MCSEVYQCCQLSLVPTVEFINGLEIHVEHRLLSSACASKQSALSLPHATTSFKYMNSAFVMHIHPSCPEIWPLAIDTLFVSSTHLCMVSPLKGRRTCLEAFPACLQAKELVFPNILKGHRLNYCNLSHIFTCVGSRGRYWRKRAKYQCLYRSCDTR